MSTPAYKRFKFEIGDYIYADTGRTEREGIAKFEGWITKMSGDMLHLFDPAGFDEIVTSKDIVVSVERRGKKINIGRTKVEKNAAEAIVRNQDKRNRKRAAKEMKLETLSKWTKITNPCYEHLMWCARYEEAADMYEFHWVSRYGTIFSPTRSSHDKYRAWGKKRNIAEFDTLAEAKRDCQNSYTTHKIPELKNKTRFEALIQR